MLEEAAAAAAARRFVRRGRARRRMADGRWPPPVVGAAADRVGTCHCAHQIHIADPSPPPLVVSRARGVTPWLAWRGEAVTVTL